MKCSGRTAESSAWRRAWLLFCALSVWGALPPAFAQTQPTAAQPDLIRYPASDFAP